MPHQRERLRYDNRLAVFSALLLEAPLARSEIALRTALTQASVSRITRDLIEAGLVEECAVHKTGRRGRQLVDLRLRPNSAFVVGMALNAFEQRIALANLERDIIAEIALPPAHALDPTRSARAVAVAVRRLVDKHALDWRDIVGMGAAVAGVVDPVSGVVIRAPTLSWHNVPFGSELEAELGLPVRLTSISEAIAAAEHAFGETRDVQDFIVVHATLGIGMCIFANGAPISGRGHSAGLVGDMTILEPTGMERTVDDVAGGGGVARRWRSRLSDKRPVEVPPPDLMLQLLEAVRLGDKRAIRECQAAAEALGRLTATLAMALATEAIVIAGPMLDAEPYRLRLEQTLRNAIPPERRPRVTATSLRRVQAACLVAIEDLTRNGVRLQQLANP